MDPLHQKEKKCERLIKQKWFSTSFISAISKCYIFPSALFWHYSTMGCKQCFCITAKCQSSLSLNYLDIVYFTGIPLLRYYHQRISINSGHARLKWCSYCRELLWLFFCGILITVFKGFLEVFFFVFFLNVFIHFLSIIKHTWNKTGQNKTKTSWEKQKTNTQTRKSVQVTAKNTLYYLVWNTMGAK